MDPSMLTLQRSSCFPYLPNMSPYTSFPTCFATLTKVTCLKGIAAYDTYRILVSELLKGSDLTELHEPTVSDVDELLMGHVEEDNDIDM